MQISDYMIKKSQKTDIFSIYIYIKNRIFKIEAFLCNLDDVLE